MLLSSLAISFAARGVAYFNMGAEYEHLKKASEALWHYQRVPFSVSTHDDMICQHLSTPARKLGNFS